MVLIQVFCDPTLPGPDGEPAGVAEVGPGRVYVSGGGGGKSAAAGRITQCQLEVGETFLVWMGEQNTISGLISEGFRQQVILQNERCLFDYHE